MAGAADPERYEVARRKGTEQAFTGAYWDTKDADTYRRIGYDEPLFRQRAHPGCGPFVSPMCCQPRPHQPGLLRSIPSDGCTFSRELTSLTSDLRSMTPHLGSIDRDM